MTGSSGGRAPGAVETALDAQIAEAAGCTAGEFLRLLERGLLDGPRLRLANAYRQLLEAEKTVTYQLALVHRLTSTGPVDRFLLTRVDRAVGHLRDAARDRDVRQETTVAALARLGTVPERGPRPPGELSARDTAALICISRGQGTTLRENALTHRLTVTTTTGESLSPAQVHDLRKAGLVHLNTSRTLLAGQSVTLTAAGRHALLAALQPPRPTNAAPRPSPGTWPLTDRPISASPGPGRIGKRR
ncbi:hypothetical protein [Streptomyces sp. RFCAC02]|uniref:hypothetical protein n=1 Tax=Streptomyces sp. RFCAC02 TaxID=2499143 RepID=UPI00102074AF|nr:hypothetical protein [Streptomyces sp. RFCAC02]